MCFTYLQVSRSVDLPLKIGKICPSCPLQTPLRCCVIHIYVDQEISLNMGTYGCPSWSLSNIHALLDLLQICIPGTIKSTVDRSVNEPRLWLSQINFLLKICISSIPSIHAYLLMLDTSISGMYSVVLGIWRKGEKGYKINLICSFV